MLATSRNDKKITHWFSIYYVYAVFAISIGLGISAVLFYWLPFQTAQKDYQTILNHQVACQFLSVSRNNNSECTSTWKSNNATFVNYDSDCNYESLYDIVTCYNYNGFYIKLDSFVNNIDYDKTIYTWLYSVAATLFGISGFIIFVLYAAYKEQSLTPV